MVRDPGAIGNVLEGGSPVFLKDGNDLEFAVRQLRDFVVGYPSSGGCSRWRELLDLEIVETRHGSNVCSTPEVTIHRLKKMAFVAADGLDEEIEPAGRAADKIKLRNVSQLLSDALRRAGRAHSQQRKCAEPQHSRIEAARHLDDALLRQAA